MMQQPGMMEQAMNMMNNMSPEDLRRAQQMAANMPPEHLASQAGNYAGAAASGSRTAGAGAQSQSHYNAALQLKTEGNGLFGQRRYREAAAKYESAITRLQGERCALVAGFAGCIAGLWPGRQRKLLRLLLRARSCAATALSMHAPRS